MSRVAQLECEDGGKTEHFWLPFPSPPLRCYPAMFLNPTHTHLGPLASPYASCFSSPNLLCDDGCRIPPTPNCLSGLRFIEFAKQT